MIARRTHTFLLSAALACAALVAGCGSDHPSGPTPTQTSPSTPARETTLVMSGFVRYQVTGATLANARLDIIAGGNEGKTAFTDSGGLYRFEQLKSGAMRVRVTAVDFNPQDADVSIGGDLTMNFQLVPIAPYVYSGYVTNSLGRPVANATVEAGPYSGSTDSSGRYEFSSSFRSAPGRVRPPDGYEPKPARSTDNGFTLNSGGQNITIRRITSVSISPPSTLKVGEHTSVNAQVSFDSGQTESPVADLFAMSSSDSTVLKVGSGNGQGAAFVEGVKAGTASVSGRYFGVSSGTFQVQVVP